MSRSECNNDLQYYLPEPEVYAVLMPSRDGLGGCYVFAEADWVYTD